MSESLWARGREARFVRRWARYTPRSSMARLQLPNVAGVGPAGLTRSFCGTVAITEEEGEHGADVGRG